MTEGKISLRKRAALIEELAVFSCLTLNECTTLGKLMTEEHFTSGQRIVVEDELIEKVYIITGGQAEVTRRVTVKKKLAKRKVLQEPLALIAKGEAIGLNDTGFFSKTGKRTATVTAVTKVDTLTLNLKSLQLFLSVNPHLQSALYSASNEILRVNLIKQSLPFARLSHERTQWLAQQVEEVSLAEGSVIFMQGDPGDKCFLIKSGKVEITRTEGNGEQRKLASLKAPALFGEATLITHEARNASAHAVEPTELLVLKHHHLSELIESEANVAKMFMTLMVDRSRPLQNPRVSPHDRVTADGQKIVILKNPDNGKYFQLSPEGWFVWKQLNGQQTMPAITMALADEHNIFSPDIVAAIISKLAKDGFIHQVEVTAPGKQRKQSWFKRAGNKIRACLEYRYAFGDADKWLTTVYQRSIYLLFTSWGKILLAFIATTGFFGFLFMTGDTIDTFKLMPDVWLLLIPFVPATLLSVALHELGHAFATKAYGREVHYMGVGWFWLGPVAFTDTSDMWLSPRIPRIVVNLAGVYTDTLVAGICGLLILWFTNPYIQGFLWIFALYTYVNAFRMLSPLQELDGYYVLMDMVDKPHLRHAAVVWLIKDFPKALRHPSLFKKHKPEVIYWLACMVFLILISMLTLFVQTVVARIFGWHASNPLISLSLPFLVALISGLGVIGDIRRQAD
jgi:putative peptide zinc metalloprotease protein